MSRYILSSDSVTINAKVTANKMTKDECQKLDIPVYYHECKHGHKLRHVSNDKCVCSRFDAARQSTHDAKRVAIKKRLDELEARRELEALERPCTHVRTATQPHKLYTII